MAWIRRHLTREGMVTTSDSWLVHRLTGTHVTDAATAGRTQLLDLDKAPRSPRALDLYGLLDERLPGVVDCARPIGTTTAFGADIPLTGLVVDQQAALLAQRITAPGGAKCTYGNRGVPARPHRRHTPARGLGPGELRGLGGWTGVPATASTGRCTRPRPPCAGLTDLGIITGPADLDRVGGTVPDNGGVTFVPALAGLAAPGGAGDLRGSLTGLGLDTTAGHLVHALCEGLAAQVVELAEAAATDLGAPLDVLRVDGGLTRSALLMQTQADLLQRPVEVSVLPATRPPSARRAGPPRRRARTGPRRRAARRETPPPSTNPASAPTRRPNALAAFRAEVTALLDRTPRMTVTANGPLPSRSYDVAVVGAGGSAARSPANWPATRASRVAARR
ncbi:FGGY-family carbohydrate kinase [Streptomyces sp. L7]